MQIHEHRGFNVEVHKVEEAYVSEVYRKGNLIHTVRGDDSQFHSHALAVEAVREWIDRIYPPGRIKYFGEVKSEFNVFHDTNKYNGLLFLLIIIQRSLDQHSLLV